MYTLVTFDICIYAVLISSPQSRIFPSLSKSSQGPWSNFCHYSFAIFRLHINGIGHTVVFGGSLFSLSMMLFRFIHVPAGSHSTVWYNTICLPIPQVMFIWIVSFFFFLANMNKAVTNIYLYKSLFVSHMCFYLSWVNS